MHRRNQDDGNRPRRDQDWRGDDPARTVQRGDARAAPPPRDDRPWREHHGHVPREFDQGGRRAHFRARGEHADDDALDDAPRWPGTARPGPRPPVAGPGQGPQGYERQRLAGGASDTRFDGTYAHAATSGYDDYETEALYGSDFDGDWARSWRRGERGSRVHGHASAGHRGRGPADYRRSDQRLLEDLADRITDDPYIDGRRLTIQVADGVVTIEGELPARWLKHHVDHIAARCFGVREVDNRIRVVRDPPADG